MRSLIRRLALSTALFALPTTAVGIAVAHAQGYIAPNPCGDCALPPSYCTCICYTPVVETHYRREQTVTVQNVQKTCYRQEPFCETIPITRTRNVMVDEGCYQMVWVPKPTMKSVPETRYVQRTNYRTVPYQVNQQIPLVQQRLVPQQRVRYIRQVRTQMVPTAPVAAAPAPTCAAPAPTCAAPSVPYPVQTQMPGCAPMPTYAPGAQGQNSPLSSSLEQPLTSQVPPITAMPVAVPNSYSTQYAPGPALTQAGPTPDPSYLETPVLDPLGRPTNSQAVPVQPTNQRSQLVPPSVTVPVRSGAFRPSPSAAAVWQSRRLP